MEMTTYSGPGSEVHPIQPTECTAANDHVSHGELTSYAIPDGQVQLSGDRCRALDESEHCEWLVTNGLGSYASGTVGGLDTRRYHGLLVAALNQPLGRTVLVSRVEETVTYNDRSFQLATNRWADGTIAPQGYLLLDRFWLEGTIPVWRYRFEDVVLEKRIWMEHGRHRTYVHYTLVEGDAPLEISVNALVNHRNHHHLTQSGSWEMDVVPLGSAVCIQAFPEAAPIYLHGTRCNISPCHDWHLGARLERETDRGLDAADDRLLAARFDSVLTRGKPLTLVASTEADADCDGAAALERERQRAETILHQVESAMEPPIRQLVLAADQFLVNRRMPDAEQGKTVLAGYPWFSDWGRDTMVALPGLLVATGRAEIAKSVLRTFSGYLSDGMLPNCFPHNGASPEYNTADASLWFVEAVRQVMAKTNDLEFLSEMMPALREIVDCHVEGTRYSIHVDGEDLLLFAGEEGTQLTWMDAKVGDWVVTPRVGKPIEINALWYNALCAIRDFSRLLGEESTLLAQVAEQTRIGMQRFWNEDDGCCYDVIDMLEEPRTDASLRPNQLFAVSLPYSALDKEQRRAVVDRCTESLYTPYGLRSLSPEAAGYLGRYQGDLQSRDGAYHQGTVWPWLIGPYALAHLRVYRDPQHVRALLRPLLENLPAAGLGTISEVCDGDAPHTARGAIAQAWSVAEILRVWHALGAKPLTAELPAVDAPC